ncbi:MAG: NUDIX domain-containing protein, partial [Chlamydiia bacterium]|nr:NUDIX domain-containing protein [Chlamydiia bacterium]
YSRARNLHAGAKEIVCKYGGAFPSTKEDLLKIKGLGSYTAGAILAFAFQKRAAAVDGNVRRVLARYDAIQLSIDLPSVQKVMEERTLALLPTTDPHQVMEGLIELGALICQKNPQCFKCPLSNGCRAYINGLEKELPIRRKRPKILALHRLVWIAIQGNHVLVSKGKKGKVMADLWHFPFFELDTMIDIEVVEKELESFLGQVTYAKELDTIKHGFTRYQATLYPHVWVSATQVELLNHTWVHIDQLTSLPFCSGHRELARELKSVVLSLGV